MKCSKCGYESPEESLVCEHCGLPFLSTAAPKPKPPESPPEEPAVSAEEKQSKLRRIRKILLIILLWFIGLVILGIGIYKLVYWIEDYRITRLYTRGAYTPVLTETTMSDGRIGHALVFYGEDGDNIYLPERDQCLTICGGVARLAVADSDWFKNAEGTFDYADITFNPVLIKQNGHETQLPTVEYQIEAPSAPLKVISPASNDLNIITSSYPLEIQVVSGSSVYVNGEDVTERLDRSGWMTADLKVQPIGENIYTIVVRTPNHKETRQDVTIFRQKYDIEIELDAEVKNKSTEKTIVISGLCEVGASVVVDTAYIEDSYQMDMTTGRFSFIAELDKLGDNNIRFHATMEGRQDAVINMVVNYKPTLAQYSAKAWKMDYPELRKYYENWLERVFLCKGNIVDKFTDKDIEYLVMDVNPSGEKQWVVLQNYSDISPTIGASYEAYADVTGRYYYTDNYYPMLAARYIDAAD